MYLRSAEPRSSTTRCRIASSSRPSSSICSSVSVMVFVMVISSEVYDDVPDRHGDAQLDLLLRLGVHVAGQDVAGAAGGLHLRAGEADAHPAAVFGGEAGRLRLLEQGGPRVLDRLVAEADG